MSKTADPDGSRTLSGYTFMERSIETLLLSPFRAFLEGSIRFLGFGCNLDEQ